MRPRQKKQKERLGGRTVILVVLVLAVLVGGGWVAAYELAGDKLRHGTSVAGVDVGDRTPDQAAQALVAGLAVRTSQPITVRVGGRKVRVDPARAGLTLDARATVAAGVSARSWRPVDLWNHYTDGADLAPVIRVDRAKLATIARRIDARAGTAARNGTVRIIGNRVAVTDPVAGHAVDVDELGRALRSAYLSARNRTVDVPLHVVQPAIDGDDVQRAVDGFANPAMTSPVKLVFGRSAVLLRPRQYGRAIRLEPEDGVLKPVVDTAVLQAALHGTADATSPVNAAVRLVNGAPRVIPARPGVSYDPKEVGQVLLALVSRPYGKRVGRVPATLEEPSFTTQDARALGIRQQVSTFTAHFPYAAYRNVSIGRAARLIDGTVLRPGQTFSFNAVVGGPAPGVSPLATAVFNAMYLAGLQDVEHHAPVSYNPRYPAGREVRAAWPSVDLKFRNDTSRGVLVHATVTASTPSSPGSVTVSMWSTKAWDVTTRTGARYAVTAYQRRTQQGGCKSTPGADGFSVNLWRYFRKPGRSTVVRTEKITTTYAPQDAAVCRSSLVE